MRVFATLAIISITAHCVLYPVNMEILSSLDWGARELRKVLSFFVDIKPVFHLANLFA